MVVGSTNSVAIPLADPLQPAWRPGPVFHDGPNPVIVHDLVVARFDAALAGLEFSTYFGGGGHDSDARLAIDPNGTVHVAATSSGAVIDIDSNLVATDDFPLFHAVQPAIAHTRLA